MVRRCDDNTIYCTLKVYLLASFGQKLGNLLVFCNHKINITVMAITNCNQSVQSTKLTLRIVHIPLNYETITFTCLGSNKNKFESIT